MGVGPASIMVGNLVAGKRIAQATGRDLGIIDDQDMSRKVSRIHQTRATAVSDIAEYQDKSLLKNIKQLTDLIK